jgi:hypothetical protein
VATPAAVLNILVNANTRRATSELRRFDKTVHNTARSSDRAVSNIERLSPAFSGLGRSSNNANRGLRKLIPTLSTATRVPVYGIIAFGSAIQAAVPPAIALASALSPLVGLMGALPSAASAAAQAMGTIGLASKGVGDAIKAALDAQKTAGKDARAMGEAQRAAAERVREAVRGVADAQRGLADAHRGVRDAERGLADAQRGSQYAQEELSAARQDAVRGLVDMRMAVQGATLSEKEARLGLSQAIQAEINVLSDAKASALDRRDAELAVERARLSVQEATVGAKRAQEDYNEAQRKGIAGSDEVVSAQRAFKDAQRGVADAQRGVADANRGVADAQRSLVEATKEVRLAQKEQAVDATKAAAGVDKLQQAMKDLPPAAQQFVRFIVGLKPRLDALRAVAAEGIFPGLTRGIQSAMQNFGVFKGIIASTATALGSLAEQAGQRLGSGEWGRDLQTQGERNVETITRLGNASLFLADGLRHVMLASGPMVDFLTRSAQRFSEVFASWAESGRATGRLQAFFERTVSTTKIVVEALWDFGRALINIGEISDRVWGQDLLVGINNVAERFRAWTESVRGQRDLEAYFERWRKRWGDIADAVGDVIREYISLRREGKTVADAFAHVFADILAKTIPAAASKMAEAGPQIAWGFIRGFLQADVWGKLIVSGWLIAKFGGLKAFTAIGRTAGSAMGIGMATGVAASGFKGKMMTMFRALGPTLAGVLAVTFGPEFAKRAFEGFRSETPAFKLPKFQVEPLGAILGPLGDIERKLISLTGGDSPVRKFGEQAETAFKKAAEAGDSMRLSQLARQARVLAQDFPQHSAALGKFADAAVEAANRVAGRFRNMANVTGKNLTDIATKTANTGFAIQNKLGFHTEAARKALARNFFGAAQAVKKYMDASGKTTKEGVELIEKYMIAGLRNLGFSKKAAINLRKRLPGSKQAPGASGELRPTQTGAYISEGKANGDSVPALLEKGEYVLNRNAVRKVGKKSLDQLNYSKAPRFQGGGIVELLHPGNDADHQDHLHVATKTVQAIVRLGKKLMSMGWLVGEHPAFGGVSAVHTSGSYHYSGRAIDVNWPDPGVEAAKIRALLPMLGHGDFLAATQMPKIARAIAAGPDSPLRSITQGALDTTRAAAQEVLRSAFQKIEGAESGVLSGDGNVERIFAQVSKRLSQSKTATMALGMAGYAESGMRDLPGGHSTSQGALQLLSSTAAGLGVSPHDEGAIASLFYNRGFYGRGGANALAKQGLPAHLVAQNVQGSAFSDGSNYLAQAGPARAWMQRYGLQLGGLIGMQPGGDPMAIGAGKKKQPRTRFPKSLGGLVKKFATGKTAKIRKDAMKKLLKRTGDIGLPKAMQKALTVHSEAAADFGEFAERAGSLTDEGAITEALQVELERRAALGLQFPDVDQAAMVDGMLGRVQGKTQLDWLKDQLNELFNWRNAMIDAEKKIVELRDKVTKAIEIAKAQLERIRKTLRENEERKDRLAKRLKELQKHPQRNKDAIKTTKTQLKNLSDTIQTREGVRDGLLGLVGPDGALIKRRQTLNTARGDMLENLERIQGRGSGLQRWSALPGIGAVGGDIFTTRLAIQELTDKPIRVKAESSTDTATRPGAEELAELLRQANLRTAVSQAQYQVFKNMPTFATGGIVPGSANAPRVIEAHAGEGVFTRDQMAAMGSGNITVIVHDGAVKSDYIEVLAGKAADRAMRTSSRRASRGLPSAGGGLRG